MESIQEKEEQTLITKEAKCSGCGEIKTIKCLKDGSFNICDDCVDEIHNAVVSHIKLAIFWFSLGVIFTAGFIYLVR
jgi:hypothetical protein